MLNKQEVEGIFDVIVTREFPPSGQKKVFLIQHPECGELILKIVLDRDQRVKREIDIVTENNIINVPRILDVINAEVSGESYSAIFEQYRKAKWFLLDSFE